MIEKLCIGIVAFCVLMLIIAFTFSYEEDRACEAKGGKMVGTGKHDTMLVMAGSAPMIIDSEETKCTK